MDSLSRSRGVYKRGFRFKLMRDLIWATIIPVIAVGICLIVFIDWMNFSNLKKMRREAVKIGKVNVSEQYKTWEKLTNLQLDLLSSRFWNETNYMMNLISSVVKDARANREFKKGSLQKLYKASLKIMKKPGISLDFLTYIDTRGVVVMRTTNPNIRKTPLLKKNSIPPTNTLRKLLQETVTQRKKTSSVEVYPSQFFKNERFLNSANQWISMSEKITIPLANGQEEISNALVFSLLSPIVDPKTNKVYGAIIAGRVLNNSSYALKTTYSQITSNKRFNFSMSIDDVNVLSYANSKDAVAKKGYTYKESKLEENPKTLVESFGGNQLLSAYGPIKNSSGRIIGATRISTPYSNYSRPILVQKKFMTNLFWILPLSLLGLVLIMIPIGFLWARRHSKKVTVAFIEISDLIDSVLSGNFNAQASIHSNDELEEIGKKLNKMTRYLENVSSSIKEKEEMQRALMEILVVVSNTAEGDFTQKVELPRGKLNDFSVAFNTMIADLSTLIKEAKSGANNIHSFSNNLLSLTKSAESRSKNLAQTLQDLQDSMSQLEDTNSHSEDSTSKISKETDNALITIKSSGEKIIATANSIKDIQKTTRNVEGIISKTSKIYDSIANLNNTVRETAREADILTLNATIETSKSNSGLPRADYTDQIRVFSEKIKKIEPLAEVALTTIKKDLNEVSKNLVSNAQSIEKSSRSSVESASSLVEVIKSIQTSSDIIKNISRVRSNQKNLVDELSLKLKHLDNEHKQTVTSIAKVSILAHSLAKIIKMHIENINKFKLVNDSSSLSVQDENSIVEQLETIN